MRSKLLYLFLTCIFLFSLFPEVYAQEIYLSEADEIIPKDIPETEYETTAGCNTAEELYTFLSSGTGGTISLTGDIVWDCTELLPKITQSAVVEMGVYKIVIPAEYSMQVEGPVTFLGQGEVLFEIQGALNLSYGTEVISTGEDAVALDIRDTGSVSLTYCRIVAEGENSVAVRSDLPVGTGAVTIQLCHISGTAASIEAPAVTLDSTTAFPVPEGATVTDRLSAFDRSMRLYGISLPDEVSQEQYTEAIYGLNLWNFAFTDPDTENTIGLVLPSVWSGVPEYPAAPGSYTLTVKPDSLPEWFPVEIPEFSIPLHIVDDSVPHITVTYGDAAFGFVLLSLTNAEAFQSAEQITLYYSTDKGITWGNAAEDFTGAVVDMFMLSVEPLVPETNYLFYIEVVSGTDTKKSNILYYPNFISDSDVDFSYGGGDRDEDDFGDQGEEPPAGPIIPAPEPDTDLMPDTDSSGDGFFAFDWKSFFEQFLSLETKTEPTAEPEEETETAPIPETETETKPVPETEALLEPNPVPETEVIPETEPVPETEVIPETEPVSKPEVIPETEPVSKPEVILETEPVPETEVMPETEPVPETETLPETELAPETEVIPETEPVPETEVIPETELVPETEVIPETESVPETEVIPKTELVPEMEAYLAPLPPEDIRHSGFLKGLLYISAAGLIGIAVVLLRGWKGGRP